MELHPYFTQPEVQKANTELGILTQAWSPIGGITSYRGDDAKSTFNDPAILAIADEHGKSAAQVMLRWQLQLGHSVIPKSVRPERIAENFNVFDLNSHPSRWARWPHSTPVCAADLTPTPSPWRPSAAKSRKHDPAHMPVHAGGSSRPGPRARTILPLPDR